MLFYLQFQNIGFTKPWELSLTLWIFNPKLKKYSACQSYYCVDDPGGTRPNSQLHTCGVTWENISPRWLHLTDTTDQKHSLQTEKCLSHNYKGVLVESSLGIGTKDIGMAILSSVAFISDCLHPNTDEMETFLKLFTDISFWLLMRLQRVLSIDSKLPGAIMTTVECRELGSCPLLK